MVWVNDKRGINIKSARQAVEDFICPDYLLSVTSAPRIYEEWDQTRFLMGHAGAAVSIGFSSPMDARPFGLEDQRSP
jgi:hypothetical protein